MSEATPLEAARAAQSGGNASPAPDVVYPPVFESLAAEQLDRKQKLAATFRLFGKFGFDEGVAGHVTVRDPERTDHFWVNPFGRSFKQMRVSDLILVNHDGAIVEGEGLCEMRV